MGGFRVVFDVNVYVSAVQDSDGRSVRDLVLALPDDKANLETTALAIIGDAGEHTTQTWLLFVSKHILTNITLVLTKKYGWANDDVAEYLDLIVDLCAASGGGVVEPTTRVTDCTSDYEDNRILELAEAANSDLIVSNDVGDLVSMSPWRGRPIITARDFVSRAHPRRPS